MMPKTQDFDPDFYFGLVADNLIRNFGSRALFYADEALKKMRAIGDSEGFDLWLSIHEHLSQKAADNLDHMGLLSTLDDQAFHTIH